MSDTVYAHDELKQSVFQIFPLLCWGGEKASLAECLSFCVFDRTYSTTIDRFSTNVILLLFFFFFCSLRRSFEQTSESLVKSVFSATKESVELTRSYQSASHCSP